ncbi:hypothetical protein Tco_1399382, partial [Tanacetum coccineum]
EIGKVATKEVKVVEVTIKEGKDFLNHHVDILKEHNEKVKKNVDKKKRLYNEYV